jgi:hypothetical protein
MFVYFYDPGLAPQIIKAFKNRELTPEEIEQIFQSIKQLRAKRKIITTIAAFLVPVVFLAIAIWVATQSPSEAASVLILLPLMGAGMGWLIYWNFMLQRRGQFLRMVKKYYPELESKYPKESF